MNLFNMSFDSLPLFVTTLSGTGSLGFKDGAREITKFKEPLGVAIDAQNTTNLYVADSGNHCVRKINTTDGATTTFAGKCGYSGYQNGFSNSAKFNRPIGVLVYFGSVIVSDAENFVLRKITFDGTVTTFSGSGIRGSRDGDSQSAQFGYPCGMDIDTADNIIVADGNYNTVRQVSSNGSVITIAGSGATGSSNGPALDATFNWISDVAYLNGSIYIADSAQSLIRKLQDGFVTTYAGRYSGYRDGPLSVAVFNNGNGITFDQSGSLIFTDLGNDLIRMIRNDNMSTIAGMLNPNDNVDGPALKSTFNRPSILDIDVQGNILYVPSTDAHVIKMVCSAPCFNGGTYDCLKKTCTCAGKWMGPNCLIKTVSSSKIATSSTIRLSTQRNMLMTSESTAESPSYGSQVVVIVGVSVSVAFVIIASLLAVFWYRRLKLAMHQKQKFEMKTLHQMPGAKLSTKEAITRALAHEILNPATIDMGLTVTKTLRLTSNNKVVSIPGCCLLDIDRDININDEARLGEGGTAIIYKCSFSRVTLIAKYNFNEVALKLIKTHDEQAISMIKFEIAIMSNIPPHQNVILFVGYSETPPAIVMKYYRLSLKDMLQTDVAVSNELEFKIAVDIAYGMAHIHKNEVLHLDLKPHNVLIDVLDDGTFNCVICDFGFANFIKGGTRQFAAGLSTQNSLGITPKYAAPEMIKMMSFRSTRFDEEIHKKIDVYAYSIILFELICRRPAWEGKGHKEICDAVVSGKRPEVQNSSNLSLEVLMRECWLPNPSERPTFDAVVTTINEQYILLSSNDGATTKSVTASSII